MFRRLSHTLPKEATFPANLEELGYFLNEKDQIRQIKNPDQKYQFKVNANDRVNDLYKEAMNTCVINLAKQRLAALGFETLRLPLDANIHDNHVPIYLSPDIRTKKRVIVLFPERQIDPTILSFRVTGDESINEGSVVNLVNGVMNGPAATSDSEAPGIIITNPAQLYWHRASRRALAWHEWLNLPRPSAAHEAYRIDKIKNLIPSNNNSEEHVRYVFEHVLGAILQKDAKLDIIGLEWTGKEVVEYLATAWDKWSNRVASICLSAPQHKVDDLISIFDASDDFLDLLSRKCRAYFVCQKPRGTVVAGREDFGCNCFASGEQLYSDQIIVRDWGSMLDHFNAVHTIEGYEEPERFAVEDDDSG